MARSPFALAHPVTMTPDAPVTLESLLHYIEADALLPPWKRRDLKSAALSLSSWLLRPPGALDTRSREFRAGIASLNAMKLGVSAKRLANVLAELRFVLKRYCIRTYYTLPRSSAWQRLEDGIRAHGGKGERDLTFKLARLMAYGSSRGIAPQTFTDEAIPGFAAHLELLCIARPHQKIRDACKAWNRAAEAILGWPRHRLTVPSTRRLPTTIPIERFPSAFQADYACLRDHLTRVDPLPLTATNRGSSAPPIDAPSFSNVVPFQRSERGRRDPFAPRPIDKPLHASTIDVWMRALLYAASALVQEGVPLADVTGIGTLTTPTHARMILTHYFRKAGDRETRFTGHLAYILKRVAEIHVQADDATLETLRDYFYRMQPKHIGLTEKNRRNLLELDDRGKALLLAAPKRLAEQAMTPDRPPRRKAVDLLCAAVVAILLYAPIRGRNLCMIEIGRHLRFPNRPKEWGLLHFEAYETKNEMEITLTLPPEVLKILRLYMEQGRPELMDPRSPFLFPNRGPKWRDYLNTLVKKRVHRLTGLHVNLHLFRHIAAKIYLDDHAGEYEVVRNLLGQKRVQTTVQYYCGLEREAAVRHFQSELQKKVDASPGALHLRRRQKLAHRRGPKKQAR